MHEPSQKAPESTGNPLTVIAELPADAILDENAMAKAFGCVPRTIRRMVERYELPPGVSIAGKTCWLAGRVRRWIDEAAELQEQQARKHREKIISFSA